MPPHISYNIKEREQIGDRELKESEEFKKLKIIYIYFIYLNPTKETPDDQTRLF